jgi:hypothetical protein
MTGGYTPDRGPFTAERAERGQHLLEAALPLTATCPAARYLVEQRGLPRKTVLAAPDQLYLPSTARGRGPGDHALLSVLRITPGGEPTGLQATWIDISGAPAPVTDNAHKRDYFSLIEGGCRGACWWGGAASDEITAAEGFTEKPSALLAAGATGRVIGFGSRSWLKHKSLKGKKLTIVADRAPGENDQAADGSSLLEAHRRDYGANVDHWFLNGFLDRVWITPDPDCSCCKDPDDIWRAHGAEGVRALLARAEQGELGRPGWITRLARIRDELERQAAIKEAMSEALYGSKPLFKGVPIKTVRQAVEGERERLQPRAKPGDGGIEPWEEPISDLAGVLDELVQELAKYIATTPANLDAAALWCAMTHVHERLRCMPKLALQSPTKQCGKTTFLDCLASVVCRPKLTSGVSASAFIRISDDQSPTWCMDEADRYLNPASAGEALTAAINASSYRRFARMTISVPAANGGWTPIEFEFWCPMILAGIKALVDTVQDRSIVLVMQRARPGELKHRLIEGSSPVLEAVSRKLARWAQDLPELDLDPAMPGFLHNREADLWRPLFSIAAEAGGEWPARATQAAMKIHGQRAEDEVRLTLLLEAVKEEFGASDQMFTADLVARLIAREGEPWATIKRNGAPIDAYYLRGMLKGVVARSPDQKARQATKKAPQHFYTRADFELAWERYISRNPVNDPEHPEHPEQGAANPGPEPISAVPDRKSPSGTSGTPGAADPAAPDQGVPDGGGVPDAKSPSGTGQPIDIAGVNEGVPNVPDQIRPAANVYPADACCGFCRAPLNGAACIAHDGAVFHADACLAEHLKKGRPA